MELRFKRRRRQLQSAPREPEAKPVSSKDDSNVERPREAARRTDLTTFVEGIQNVLPLAVFGIFVMAFMAFLYWSKPFALPVVLALLLTFLLRPVVVFLARLRIPEIVGSVLVLAVFLGILAAVISNLVQPATQWVAKAPQTMRDAEQKLRKLVRPAAQLSRAAETVETITTESAGATPAPKVQIKENTFQKTAFEYASTFVTSAVETVVLLFFFLALGDTFTRKLIKVLPTSRDKEKALQITHELQHNVSLFLFTITAINACLGALVGFAVMLLGMPNPLLWGAVVALLNFIPYFGPWMGIVVLAIAGFVSFDEPARAFLPPIIYLALHAVESNFITPLILGRRLTMNPVVIFLSLMFWMWLWGVPGALISVPLLMMLKVFCDHLKPLAPLGEFISGSETEPRLRTYSDYMALIRSKQK